MTSEARSKPAQGGTRQGRESISRRTCKDVPIRINRLCLDVGYAAVRSGGIVWMALYDMHGVLNIVVGLLLLLNLLLRRLVSRLELCDM